MPDAPNDPVAAGVINTAIGNLRPSSDGGPLLGISNLVRTVVADGVDVDAGQVVARALVNLMFEFGTAAAGYFDDAIAVSTIIKPILGPNSSTRPFDYDGVVTGGTGRWMAATGRMSVVDAVFNDDGIITSTRLRFQIYVPNDLPKIH